MTLRTTPDALPIVEVAPAGLGPVAWVEAHRAELRAALEEHGSLLVRGLGIAEAATARAVFAALADRLVDDREGFAGRHDHGGGVYSSATWPAHQPMCMHHELSYRDEVPSRLFLACLRPPTSGGATAVADAHAVWSDLPRDLVERFAERGWLLVRTYGGDIGPSVLDAFGTEDRAEVERYCAEHGIEHEWRADGVLATRQRRPAVVTHPRTGRPGWVNQVAFLSEWTLEPDVRDFLVEVYGEDALPFTTRYGTGEPVEREVVETVNAVYDRHARRVPWQAGDLMLLDNLATAHNRDAYEGEREVVVALADPVRLTAATALVAAADGTGRS